MRPLSVAILVSLGLAAGWAVTPARADRAGFAVARSWFRSNGGRYPSRDRVRAFLVRHG
jgi:hypothetical protein